MTDNEAGIIKQILKISLDSSRPLSSIDQDHVEVVMENFESGQNTATLHVLMTLLAKKIISPEQDIRCHKTSIESGFSGRTLDSSCITPFLRKHGLTPRPSTGWQTHSLQQNYPYDETYPGVISPEELKIAFLYLVNRIQTEEGLAQRILFVILPKLVEIRERSKPPALIRPRNRTVAATVSLMERLWEHTDSSRVPVLAVFAAYQCLVSEVGRYKKHELLPPQFGAETDEQTDRAGNIDLVLDGKIDESVSVNHGVEIDAGMVERAIERIKGTSVRRCYILSTNSPIAEIEEIPAMILDPGSNHACEFIVDGIAPTLAYCLRLMRDTDDFIDNFVELLEADELIDNDLKRSWNAIQ